MIALLSIGSLFVCIGIGYISVRPFGEPWGYTGVDKHEECLKNIDRLEREMGIGVVNLRDEEV